MEKNFKELKVEKSQGEEEQLNTKGTFKLTQDGSELKTSFKPKKPQLEIYFFSKTKETLPVLFVF